MLYFLGRCTSHSKKKKELPYPSKQNRRLLCVCSPCLQKERGFNVNYGYFHGHSGWIQESFIFDGQLEGSFLVSHLFLRVKLSSGGHQDSLLESDIPVERQPLIARKFKIASSRPILAITSLWINYLLQEKKSSLYFNPWASISIQ